MTMREKMARRLCFVDGYDPDDDGGIPGVARWRSYLFMADAALAALEEPTREMWASGGDAVVGKTKVHHGAVLTAAWRAMIGAAKEEGC